MKLNLEAPPKSGGKPPRSSRPPTIPDGPPRLTSHIEGIYWALVNNTYGIEGTDAGVLAMILEWTFKELKKARKKRERAEKTIMRSMFKRSSRVTAGIRKLIAGVLWFLVAVCTVVLLMLLWQQWGG